MSGSAKDFQSIISKLHKAVADYQEGCARIEREFDTTKKALSEDQERNRNIRRSNWQAGFAKEWERNATAIANASSQLRQHQPAFVDFVVDKPLMASEIPAGLVLGSEQVSFEKLSCHASKVISFPFSSALVFPQGDAEQKHLVHCLLLRLLQALPVGQVELTLIDPLQQGQSVEPFLPLLKVEQLVPQGHVLTRSDEIEAALGKLTDEIEELIQQRFNDKASNWSQYNAVQPDAPLPYKVVLLFDVPEQISEKSLWFLGRICENGPRCGVLPIIAIDEQRMEDRRYEKLNATLKNSTTQLNDLLQRAGAGELSFTYQPEQWPRQDVLDGFLARLVEDCAAKTRFKKTMPDLWTSFGKGETTLGGFDIPIGWTTAGDFATLRLGATDSEHHVLLAGKTGSGKSNLLHVLIHTLCEKYPTEELDLYLLDYKESTEFNIYATPPVPQARLVATESDPEYGVTVLRHLVDELETRARIFKSKNVNDFSEYRKSSGVRLPRVLLVIDEFQILFSESRQVAEAAEQLLSKLLKQGRSFGIHILLATQTLKGINAQSIGSIITQLGCRIALACGQEDSAMILGGGNWAAAELRSPPEGIINNANGAKSGNVKFMIPFAGESEHRRDLLKKLIARTSLSGVAEKAKIFSGAFLPQMPSPFEYQTACAHEEALLLGENLAFDSKPLTVSLTRRSAFNVLFSGYNDHIHDGLLSATLFSLTFVDGFDEIVYFNARGVPPGGGFSAAAQMLGARLKMFDDISDLPLQAISDDIGNRRVALIIDGLDSEKALQPAPAFRSPKPGEPPTPADLLKRLAEDGPRKGTFVFIFVDRWQRCASASKDLFSFFELRVAYCMNEDDAGSLVSGGVGKFKGIEKPSRAVFVNKMTNDITWFRPYVQESTQ
ncbi:FtsK/SpoIIIE domain-containing protein [Pseudomonas aeruginosa]